VPLRPFLLSEAQEKDLRALTRAAFAMRRKQFQKILRSAAGYQLEAAQVGELEQRLGYVLTVRPEELSASQFVELSKLLRQSGHPSATGNS
jgi:16S rRNA A1518/A1519 N6-dimethyltransferase RsmA/KsgA/DIM1 with predicted DNA glycosylase/AP lyase activity